MGQDFEIDEGAIAQLMSEIQRAFDKHSIRVPIEGEPSMKLAGRRRLTTGR